MIGNHRGATRDSARNKHLQAPRQSLKTQLVPPNKAARHSDTQQEEVPHRFWGVLLSFRAAVQEETTDPEVHQEKMPC